MTEEQAEKIIELLENINDRLMLASEFPSYGWHYKQH